MKHQFVWDVKHHLQHYADVIIVENVKVFSVLLVVIGIVIFALSDKEDAHES